MSSPATRLTHAARSVTGNALDNARRAAEHLSSAVAERRVLEHLLDEPEAGDLARLTHEECLRLLGTKSVGRLAYIARAGIPAIVPVNYVLDGEAVLIRSAPGPKLQAAERREVVAFEVDDIDEITHTGWSVLVTGRSRRTAPEELTAAAPTPWARGPRRHTIRIETQRIDGRRLL